MKFYYDLMKSPPTYDGISAACLFKHMANEAGASKIEVEILPGPIGGFRRDNLWPYTVKGRQQMLENVLVPIFELLPNTTVTVHRSRPPLVSGPGVGRKMYGLNQLVATYQRGIRPLRPPREVARGPMITITLREAEHWPDRNSKIDEWLEVARRLKARGHPVVFVRDTLKFDEDLPGTATSCPAASKNITSRADLYASAMMNLFVMNGPAWLSMCMDQPTLIMRPGQEGAGRSVGADFLRAHGLHWGAQMPNMPTHQRLVWEDDTADNIMRAVDSFMAAQPRREVA